METSLDADWYELSLDHFVEVAKSLGILTTTNQIYFSGFSSQGDGACFAGYYSYSPNAPAKLDYDPVLYEIACSLQELQAAHGYKLEAGISRWQGARYNHPYSVSIDVEFNNNDVPKEVEKQISQLLRDFMNWMYFQLEAEYDYQLQEEENYA